MSYGRYLERIKDRYPAEIKKISIPYVLYKTHFLNFEATIRITKKVGAL